MCACVAGHDQPMDLLSFIADQRCVVCGLRGYLLCGECRSALPWLQAPLCARCGDPRPAARIACPACTQLSHAVGTVRAALVLEGAGQALVRGWKDSARYPIAALAAVCVVAAVPRPSVDALVAVPAARDRAAWRGVDGPRDLAMRLGRVWDLPLITDVLERVGDRPQRGLRAEARRRNANASFVARESVVGRVLLVDDVMTTGATIRTCAGLLRGAGAERVDAVTLARVVIGP